MIATTLTLTGGWAIFAIACIIHFIIVSVCGIVKWLETRKIKKGGQDDSNND